jgi:hypothetical protein
VPQTAATQRFFTAVLKYCDRSRLAVPDRTACLPLPRDNYVTIHLYCDAERLSLCRRGHSFRRDDLDMNVFCFAERLHAEQLQARFGGEFIDPNDRPKWPGSRR